MPPPVPSHFGLPCSLLARRPAVGDFEGVRYPGEVIRRFDAPGQPAVAEC